MICGDRDKMCPPQASGCHLDRNTAVLNTDLCSAYDNAKKCPLQATPADLDCNTAFIWLASTVLTMMSGCRKAVFNDGRQQQKIGHPWTSNYPHPLWSLLHTHGSEAGETGGIPKVLLVFPPRTPREQMPLSPKIYSQLSTA
eukprot:scaffold95157_cov17-Tisochrysis_lutea.AAC.1